MIDLLFSPFADFSFMRRALFGCLMISLTAPVIGMLLVYRRMSLTGDAMSHAILPGVAVGYLIGGLSVSSMTIGGLIAGVTVIILSGFASKASKTAEDASLASFYLISLAAGVLIISVSGSNVDLLHILFGSPLALTDQGLTLLASITSVSLIVLAIFIRPLAVECFDPGFLETEGVSSQAVHTIFLILTVLSLISGFQTIGTLMAVGIMILPCTSVKLWFRHLTGQIAAAVAAASAGSAAGLLLSFHLDWPASSSIILCLGVFYIFSLIFGINGGLIWKFVHLRHYSG